MILGEVVNNQRLGSHCATTSLAIVTNYYGHPFSESLCFGLGSGIGFTYQKYIETGFYFFTGRNESLELNLASQLGGVVEYGSTDSAEEGWLAVKNYIDKGVPVILDLNITHLPHFSKYMNDLGSVSFGLHSALLVGYNLQKKEAFLLDHRWNDVISISFEDLSKARCSREAPVNPRNGWKVMMLPQNRIDMEYAIREAIRINVHRMKYPFAYKMGLAGVKMFAKESRIWRKILSPEEKKTTAKMATIFLEKLGTGAVTIEGCMLDS
jgi:hypothetical protein